MDFIDFCMGHFSPKQFRVKKNQLEIAIATYLQVGTRVFTGTEATRATGHRNIGAIMSALCHGKVIVRITKSTKIYEYQFNPAFVNLVQRWQAMYRVEHPAQPTAAPVVT